MVFLNLKVIQQVKNNISTQNFSFYSSRNGLRNDTLIASTYIVYILALFS